MNCPAGAATPVAHLMKTVACLVRRASLLFIFITAGFAIVPSLCAQATGSFSGTIADKSGGNVPGATVTATSAATGLARTGKTDESGHYLIPLLPVGGYTIDR